MRVYVVSIILLISLSVKAQEYLDHIYVKGYLLTNNDTVSCNIKLQGSYDKYVYYKHKGDYVFKAHIDTVRYVITDYNSFGKVTIKSKTVLARIICWGKINFYEYHVFVERKTDSNGNIVFHEDYMINYIEKDGVIVKIKSKRINDKIRSLFSDNSKIYDKLSVKRLKKERLIELIQQYNKESSGR